MFLISLWGGPNKVRLGKLNRIGVEWCDILAGKVRDDGNVSNSKLQYSIVVL